MVENSYYLFILFNQHIASLEINNWKNTKFETEVFNKNINYETLGKELITFERFEIIEDNALAYSNVSYLKLNKPL